MDYQIIRLKIDRLDEIYKVICQTLDEDFSVYPPRVRTIYKKHIYNKKHFRKLLITNKSCILGTLVENKLIGFLSIKREYGGVVFFDWLAVKKEFRNQGVGKTLLNEGEKWALKNKFHYVYLFTETEKNIEYYKKRGFYYIGIHKNSWFGMNEYQLGKSLRKKPFKEMFEKYLKVNKKTYVKK